MKKIVISIDKKGGIDVKIDKGIEPARKIAMLSALTHAIELETGTHRDRIFQIVSSSLDMLEKNTKGEVK